MTTTDEPRLDHDLRCPELTHPQLEPDPTRCTCRGDDGHTPRESWADGPMCGFDLETTDPDPLVARIVTATVVLIRPGQPTRVVDWLSDVDGEEIPDEAAAIHGVTTERARAEGRPLRDVVREIRFELELAWAEKIPVVGWNVCYDLTVLGAETGRFGHSSPFRVSGPVIDGLVLDKQADRYVKGKGQRQLTAAAQRYSIELSDADAHSSAADALAAARIVWRIARQRHTWVGDLDLDELHRKQIRWYREQTLSFGAYLRDKVAPGVDDETERAAVLAKADEVDAQAGGWPMRRVS